MNDSHFEELINEAIESLPKYFKEKIENVSVVIADWPSKSHFANLGSRHGLLLGLYEGVPKTKRVNYGIGGALPDKITLFKYPILLVARPSGDIKKVIRDTVIHEIGHHFGLTESDVQKAKLQP